MCRESILSTGLASLVQGKQHAYTWEASCPQGQYHMYRESIMHIHWRNPVHRVSITGTGKASCIYIGGILSAGLASHVYGKYHAYTQEASCPKGQRHLYRESIMHIHGRHPVYRVSVTGTQKAACLFVQVPRDVGGDDVETSSPHFQQAVAPLRRLRPEVMERATQDAERTPVQVESKSATSQQRRKNSG